MLIQFNTSHQYLFYHQNVKHLFLLWKKEQKRELYIVEENNNNLLLQYPGETYIDTLLHQIEPIFFQRITTENETLPIILGATFQYDNRLMGMYYTPPNPVEPLYFFEIHDENIKEISDEEYKNVVRVFAEEFEEYIVSTV